MPDAQPQDTTAAPSPAVADLAGQPPDKGSSAISDLLKVKRQQVAAETRMIDESERRSDAASQRAEAAFKAEGIGPNQDLKPWDAEKEHKRFEENPIEGFGSVGGLFAMIASAFTRAPMDSAINGMASAINASKQGNEDAYKRAYDSYKENTKLALERHRLMHEQYQDALSLWSHDTAASQAKLHNLAVKFGDQNTLMLLEHGMSKDLFEMIEARNRAALQTQELSERTTEKTLRDAAYKSAVAALPKTGNPQLDAAHKLALFTRTHNAVKTTPQQELMGQFFLEHPDATAEEAAAFADKHGIIRQYGLAGGAGGVLSRPKAEQLEVNRRTAMYTDEYKKEGMSDDEAHVKAYDRAQREVAAARSVPSGNRVDDLRSKIDQTDNILTGIDKQLDTLKRIKGVSGLAGKIMRGEEIVGNIAGTTDTDRVEFRRRVHELQEIVPRILTDSSGRPLKSAQEKVDDIVAGLNAGDTGPNTMRAYEELRDEIRKRQQDYRGRLEGGYQQGSQSSGASARTPAATTSKTPADNSWYKNAPLVGN